MFKSILILFVLILLSRYIVGHLRFMKVNDFDNEENYWMFSYDFREKKKDFQKESQETIIKKNQKNKLVLLLYSLWILIFIYGNLLLTQILFFILN